MKMYRVGCSTGISAGDAPRKTRSTRRAWVREFSAMSMPYEINPPARAEVTLIINCWYSCLGHKVRDAVPGRVHDWISHNRQGLHPKHFRLCNSPVDVLSDPVPNDINLNAILLGGYRNFDGQALAGCVVVGLRQHPYAPCLRQKLSDDLSKQQCNKPRLPVFGVILSRATSEQDVDSALLGQGLGSRRSRARAPARRRFQAGACSGHPRNSTGSVVVRVLGVPDIAPPQSGGSTVRSGAGSVAGAPGRLPCRCSL